MIMGPFGLNGLISDISGDILFGWLSFHPTDLSLGGVSVREDVANTIKCQICNGESTKLWHCPWLRNGPISYRYEVTVKRSPGPCSSKRFNKKWALHWTLPPSRGMAG